MCRVVVDWAIKFCIYAVCNFERFFCLYSFKSDDLHIVVENKVKRNYGTSKPAFVFTVVCFSVAKSIFFPRHVCTLENPRRELTGT